MNTIEIKKQNAAIAYNSADAKGKKLLEDLLGKENVLPVNVTDRIKTFDDVLKELGKLSDDVYQLLDKRTTDPDMVSAKSYMQLVLIARALNEGWTPDWTDSSQYKYFPYFRHKSGFGLSYHAYDIWTTLTTVGSRLCFKSSELAEYAGTQFAAFYNNYLTIK